MNRLNYALKVLAVILLGLALASCTDTDGPPEDLVGIAAAGAETQGTVFVVGADGREISKTINSDGSFKFDVRGMTAPFMLKTVASNGVDADLFSYASEANVTANITPLTNLTMFIASGSISSAELSAFYDSWVSVFGTISAQLVKDAQATVNANLSTQYTAFSLDPFTYDFIETRFLTNGTSVDGLIDAMTVDLLAGTVAITGVVSPIVLDLNVPIVDFDIGGVAVATTGAYTVSVVVTVNTVSSGSLLLAINLPSVPTDVDTQIVEDIFSTFYGSVGAIVINSVTVTPDVDTPTTIIAVVDATITPDLGDPVNYSAAYTYTLNP